MATTAAAGGRWVVAVQTPYVRGGALLSTWHLLGKCFGYMMYLGVDVAY